MQLLLLIKRIFIVVIAVVNSGYAMEQKIINYVDTAENFMREFPFMSYKLAQYRYTECCNEEVKKEINKKFNKTKNAFNKIMFCAWNVIGKTLIKNEQLYQVSFNIPMREMHKVLENWQWAVEVYTAKDDYFNIRYDINKPQHVPYFMYFLTKLSSGWPSKYETNNNLIKKKLFENGSMMRYADQIKHIDQCLKEKFYLKHDRTTSILHRSTLEAFDLLNKKISTIHDDGFAEIKEYKFSYNYYYTHTLKNFFSVLKNQKGILSVYICFVVPIMTAWASEFIENNFCQKILTHDDIRLNEAARIFNEGLNKVKAQKANIRGQVDKIMQQHEPFVDYYVWFKSPRTMIEPYYSWTDFCKINIPFAVLGCLMSLPELLPLLRKGRIFYENDDSTPLAWIVVYGGLLKLVAWVLEIYSISFLGAMAATSTFFLGLACCKTLYDICAMQECRMGFEDIPAALKRHNDGEIKIVG